MIQLEFRGFSFFLIVRSYVGLASEVGLSIEVLYVLTLARCVHSIACS